MKWIGLFLLVLAGFVIEPRIKNIVAIILAVIGTHLFNSL